ncbi:MAG: ATP-binding protein [Candidatus Lokiarchaeota archaeon]|nr:ATP-binding protein [Candidatus Lokiarchaeota archaeon]
MEEDQENKEIIDQMNIALKKLKDWLQSKTFTSKSERFEGREPIGAVTAPIKNEKFVYVVISREDKEQIPQLSQILLIFDERFDAIVSGIVTGYKITKSDLDLNNAVIKVDLLNSHGVNLRDIRKVKIILNPGSPVFMALPEEVLNVHGYPSPSEGITLGIILENEELLRTEDGPIKYILKDDFISKHICISGVTGQGKSVLLKNMIFELVTKPTNLIVFDTQGDLVQVMKKMPEEYLDAESRLLLNDLNLKYQGLEDNLVRKAIKFYKPVFTKVGGFLDTFPWENFGLESKFIRSGEELSLYLPELTQKARNALMGLYKIFTDEHQTFHLDSFIQWMKGNEKEIDKNQVAWTDMKNSREIKLAKSTSANLLRELENFSARGIFDQVTQPDIQDILSKKIVFFYLPRIIGYEEVRTLLVFDIISKIINFKMQAANQDKFPGFLSRQSIIIIDEAHEILPNPYGLSGYENIFSEYVDREFCLLAAEGRKYNVSQITASQRLRKLNPNVVEQSNTQIFFRGSKKDIDTLSIPLNLKKELFTLKVGHAIVNSPGNLPMKNDQEIKVIPPKFLHVNPLTASKLVHEGKIKKIS